MQDQGRSVVSISAYIAWLSIHFLYSFYSAVALKLKWSWRKIWRFLFCRDYSYEGRVRGLAGLLQSPPKHLGIALTYESGNLNDESMSIDIRSLARLVAWASAARIPLISLYDYHGHLKQIESCLRTAIKSQVSLGTVNIHVAPHQFPQTPPNGTGGSSLGGLDILLLSNSDGREELIDRTRNLVEDPKDLTDEKLETKLRVVGRGFQGDPELLLVVGQLRSTLGFLPWHIRLTEIRWLPTLDLLDIEDFEESLLLYGGTQQRFGT